MCIMGSSVGWQLQVCTVKVVRMQFHHHAGVAPLSSAIGRAHTVHHYLPTVSGCRNDEATRAHTEAINATAINLCHERIFGGRQITSAPLTVVVLYLVDKVGGMLQAHTYGNAFGLNLYIC